VVIAPKWHHFLLLQYGGISQKKVALCEMDSFSLANLAGLTFDSSAVTPAEESNEDPTTRGGEEIEPSEEEMYFIPESTKLELWRVHYPEHDEFDCQVCGVPVTIGNFGIVHSISPRDGGKATLDNLSILCEACESTQ